MDEAIDGLNKRLREKAATRATVLIGAGVIPAEAVAQAIEELVGGFEQDSEKVADRLASRPAITSPTATSTTLGFGSDCTRPGWK